MQPSCKKMQLYGLFDMKSITSKLVFSRPCMFIFVFKAINLTEYNLKTLISNKFKLVSSLFCSLQKVKPHFRSAESFFSSCFFSFYSLLSRPPHPLFPHLSPLIIATLSYFGPRPSVSGSSPLPSHPVAWPRLSHRSPVSFRMSSPVRCAWTCTGTLTCFLAGTTSARLASIA